MGVRCVLTNLFGAREVLAYVTSAVKDGGELKLRLTLSYNKNILKVCKGYMK